MASTPAGFVFAPPAAIALSARPAPPLSRVACGLIALASIALALAIASAYPIMPLALVVAVVAWAAFATFRFSLAWPALIALVPAIGFATWTGWIVFEEIDLLVLASAAGGYAALALGTRLVPGEPHVRPKLSVVALAVVALYLASLIVALVGGINASAPTPFSWSAGYDSWENAIRIFKSFALAVLLLPLLVGELRKPGGLDRFAMAMTASLGVGTLLVLRERLQFSGLLDFTDDYRVVGGFWEMHVGGAALDSFLALTLPFALREALHPAHRVRFGIALGVLLVATYACLVTFSRVVYVAIPVEFAVAMVLVARARARPGRAFSVSLPVKAVLFTLVVGAGAFFAFRSGGYRASIALLGMIAAFGPVDRSLRSTDVAGAIAATVGAVVVAALTIFVASMVPKGPYLVYAMAFVCCAIAIVQAERTARRTAHLFVVATWLWVAMATVDVAYFWGYAPALRDTGGVVALLVATVIVLSRLPRSIWPAARREQVVTIALAAGVFGVVVAFTAGAYMTQRFSNTSGDLQLRLDHWREGIGRLHGADWIAGVGLGRFYAMSLGNVGGPDLPGAYAVRQAAEGPILVVAAPHVRYLSFYELMRVTQRVTLRPHTSYLLRIALRAPAPTNVQADLCEIQLLYVADCRSVNVPAPVSRDQFTPIEFRFDSGEIGTVHALGRRPASLAIAASVPGGVLEIQRVQLIGPDGVDVVTNGRFTEGTTRWFSSSDRIHLPWHIKNVWLGVLLDQGVIGLALFILLVGGAFLRSSVGSARRHPDAPFVAAAIVGYLAVGMGDSLLDVPRVALLFYLVTFVGLMLRSPRATAAAPTAPDGAALLREQEERQRRRSNAFGERVPRTA